MSQLIRKEMKSYILWVKSEIPWSHSANPEASRGSCSRKFFQSESVATWDTAGTLSFWMTSQFLIQWPHQQLSRTRTASLPIACLSDKCWSWRHKGTDPVNCRNFTVFRVFSTGHVQQLSDLLFFVDETIKTTVTSCSMNSNFAPNFRKKISSCNALLHHFGGSHEMDSTTFYNHFSKFNFKSSTWNRNLGIFKIRDGLWAQQTCGRQKQEGYA